VPTGELRVGVSTLRGEKFDPVIAPHGDCPPIMGPIYDWLIRTNGIIKVPGVADSWTIAADGLSWTFNIHKGIKFSDGTDLTSADVKFSIDRYASSVANESALRDGVSRVDIVDQYTVRVYTKGVQPYLADFMAFFQPRQGAVQPKAYFEKVGSDYFASHPIGSGSFKFVRQGFGDYIEYEGVSNHWRMTPAFKTVILLSMPEEAVRVASLQTATVGFIESNMASYPRLTAAGYLTEVAEVLMTAFQTPGALHPDAKGTPIADVRVRQALSLAINRDEINQTLFNGQSLAPVPARLFPGSPEVDLARWEKWAATNYVYDPIKAKKLLSDAGYPNGFSGIKLSYSPEQGSEYLGTLAEIYQSYWKKIGVNVDLVFIDNGVWRTLRYVPAKDIIGQLNVNEVLFNPLVSKQLSNGFQNSGNQSRLLATGTTTSSPNIDPLLSQANSEIDPVKRGKVLDQIIEQVADLYLFVEVGSTSRLFSYSPKLTLLPGRPREDPGAFFEYIRPKS
jgi:peptide/nickel transport system substrate-binding protein